MIPARHAFRIFAVVASCALLVAAAAPLQAQGDPSAASSSNLTLVLALVGALAGVIAIVLSLRAAKLAAHAAQEAGAARARAAQGHGHLTPEALAATERVWATKFAALEAQLQSGGRGGITRPPSRENGSAGGDVGTRLIELEKVVAGLSVQMQQPRRAAASTAATEPAWPSCLTAETSAMQDVRSALSLALKSREPSAREFLDKLRATDQWATARPSATELVATLVSLSTLLLTALRKGASVAPLDGALLSDRVLAALRPIWKPLHPAIDCRSFYPGATFDPDWMEDHTRTGLRRPVISEMLSWAVFEKTDANHRLLAKAHITAD